MFDGVRTRRQRHVNAIDSVRMDCHFLPVQMRGIDERFDLVIEQLSAEPCANAAVDTARGGDLDDVNAAPDLQAHRMAAAFDTVAQIFLTDGSVQIFTEAERRVHMAARGGYRFASVNNARSRKLARRDRVAQGQSRAAAIA